MQSYIKKYLFFVKLLIRWVDCSSCGDDYPSGVDIVPKVELNGMLMCHEIFTLKLGPKWA